MDNLLDSNKLLWPFDSSIFMEIQSSRVAFAAVLEKINNLRLTAHVVVALDAADKVVETIAYTEICSDDFRVPFSAKYLPIKHAHHNVIGRKNSARMNLTAKYLREYGAEYSDSKAFIVSDKMGQTLSGHTFEKDAGGVHTCSKFCNVNISMLAYDFLWIVTKSIGNNAFHIAQHIDKNE